MRVPLVYLPCCPVPNCLGKQGELSGNCLPNLTVRFILSPSIILSFQFDNFSVALRVREAAGGTEERAVRQRARWEEGAQDDGRRLQPPGLRRRPAQGSFLIPRPRRYKNLISVKVPANSS